MFVTCAVTIMHYYRNCFFFLLNSKINRGFFFCLDDKHVALSGIVSCRQVDCHPPLTVYILYRKCFEI